MLESINLSTPNNLVRSFFYNLNNEKLASYQWKLRDIPSKAIIILVHGFTGHVTLSDDFGSPDYIHLYSTFAQVLNSKGFDVYAFDAYGHGHSEGDRCYFDNFSIFIEDLYYL